MARALRYLRLHFGLCLAGSLLMVVEAIGEIVQPFLMTCIIDVGIPNHDQAYIAAMGIGMVLTALVMMLAQVFGVRCCVRASMRFGRDLRRAVFQRMQSMPSLDMERFGEPSLVMRLTNDITQIQNVTLSTLKIWIKAPMLIVLGCLMAFFLDKELSMVLIVAMPLLAIVVVSLSLLSFPRFDAMQQRLDSLNERVQENLVGIRVVKAFARGDFEAQRFGKANNTLRQTSERAYATSVSITPIIMLIMNATVVVVVWLGGNKILNGTMNIGTIQAYAAYVLEILAALLMVGLVIVESTRAVASFRRVAEVLGWNADDLASTDAAKTSHVSETRHADSATADAQQVEEGRVEFRDVSFRYYKNNPLTVLDRVSFVAEPGQTVGIIGSTGSGKSTVVGLLARLYDVDEGSVLVDGRDVRSYDVYDLRKAIGFVPQRSVLFSGPIRKNLRWGDATASDDTLVHAATVAQANDFVQDMPKGYDTELTQGGSNVSGGQRQRLCIARALVGDPKILVLDDSTSAVDAQTDRLIREGIERDYAHATKIIVAQRVEALREADFVVVMDEGRIVGQGTHEELLKTCATYAEINASQSMGGVV